MSACGELFLKRNRQRFSKGTRKDETQKLYLTFVGEILYRSPGPHPGGQTLTSSGIATPRKAGPRQPGPTGRPAASCFQLSLTGPRSPRATPRRPYVCLGPRLRYPGTCLHVRASARACRLGSRAQSVLAFWESIRTRRARSSPGLPGAGASGREVERRLPFLSLVLRAGRPSGDLTLGPISHS